MVNALQYVNSSCGRLSRPPHLQRACHFADVRSVGSKLSRVLWFCFFETLGMPLSAPDTRRQPSLKIMESVGERQGFNTTAGVSIAHNAGLNPLKNVIKSNLSEENAASHHRG